MRLGALLPRAVVVALAWILATAAFTLAADRKIIGPSRTAAQTPAQTPPLTVPEVTGQAFVFAKGLLEDAGFGWRVDGPVRGFSGNQVIAQSPAAGTKVLDTGAPTVVLRLVRGRYPENGSPEDSSSYEGTALKLATKPKPAAAPPPAQPKPQKPQKPHKTVRKPAAKHATRKRAHAVRKPAKQASRPPAFNVPRTPKEPLDEIPLTERADRLAAWIATGPKRTPKNVQRWLYQHSWIVTGARFGWWHGEQALVKLIAVDRRIHRMWGIGRKSEAVAHAALKHVRRKER
jgi:hypothetical protein